MTILFEAFLVELKKYDNLIRQLYEIVETQIHFAPAEGFDLNFTFAQKTILAQIKHWPEGEFKYPPAAWVHPRKGFVVLAGVSWEYAFHGAGLSFFHRQTRQDISIEFTESGDLGITKSTTKIVFDDLKALGKNTIDFTEQYDVLFEDAVQLAYLYPVPPLFGQGNDEQTYLFAKKFDLIKVE